MAIFQGGGIKISQFLFSVDTMAGKWHRMLLVSGRWILDARYWILVAGSIKLKGIRCKV